MIKTNNKGFYKWVIYLTIPIAIENLINVGVTSSDVIMMGLVSDVALSAVSLASQVQFILTIFYFGLSSGAMVLMSQYWGKKDYKALTEILSLVLRFAFAMGIIFSLLVFLIPGQIMRIFTNEQRVIDDGINYLRIVGFSYILSSFSVTFLNVIRSMEKVMMAAVVYFISFTVNIAVNSVLIFGLFGLPKMGVRGAAIGTVVARTIEVLIALWYLKFRLKMIPLKIKHFFKINRLLLKDFINYSAMVVVNELTWGLGISAISVIVGHMGIDVIGANSVCQVTRQLAMVVSFGVAAASAIVIGKTIGEENYNLVWTYSKKLVKLAIYCGIFGSILIITLRPILTSVFTIGEMSKQYLSTMLYILAFIHIFQDLNATFIVGMFRGGGDTKFGLWVDFISMWFFALPLGAIAAFFFNLRPEIVYLILISDEIVKVPFTFKRYLSKKWIKNVTRNI